MLGSLVTRRYGADGLPAGHDRHHLPRLGRPVVRRVPAARASRCGCSATPTTTSARACPAACIAVRPRRDGAVRRRAERHRRQRHRLRRDVRRDLPARRRGRAVLRAQLRRHRGRRGRRRPRAGVHDRRHRGDPRARPAATSAPACPAGYAYVLDLDAGAGQPRAGRRRTGAGDEHADALRGDRRAARWRSPARRWRRRCWPTGRPRWRRFRADRAARLPAGARGDPAGRRRTARTSTRR